MALSVKDPEADRLAREVVARTGETLTTAVIVALRSSLRSGLRSRPAASLQSRPRQRQAHPRSRRRSLRPARRRVSSDLASRKALPMRVSFGLRPSGEAGSAVGGRGAGAVPRGGDVRHRCRHTASR